MSHVLLYRLGPDARLAVEPDEARWREWMMVYENRCLAFTEATLGVAVSTVFLGVNWGTEALPRYFQTLVLGGPLDGDSTLVESYHEAEVIHDITVQRVRRALANPAEVAHG
jgi:hypothetical protein